MGLSSGTEHVRAFHVITLSPHLLGCVLLFCFYSSHFRGTEPLCPSCKLWPIVSEDYFFRCRIDDTRQVTGTVVALDPGGRGERWGWSRPG